MIRRFKVVLVAVVLILTGCAGKGVIPARKMSKILHDMYVLDAQLSQVQYPARLRIRDIIHYGHVGPLCPKRTPSHSPG